MPKEIYIKMKDGEKESEMKLSETSEAHQLAIMDGVFKFFDLDIDFKEIADIYSRSGKAYQSFFSEMNPVIDYKQEVLEADKDPDKETEKFDTLAYEQAIKESSEADIQSQEEKEEASLEPVPEETEVKEPEPPAEESKEKVDEKVEQSQEETFDYTTLDPKSYYVTGIKIDNLGRPNYKCRYKCPKCKDESNHYIKPGTKHVRCWKCGRVLKVSPATAFGEPVKGKNPEQFRDSNGNFYIAGAFEQELVTLSESEATAGVDPLDGEID